MRHSIRGLWDSTGTVFTNAWEEVGLIAPAYNNYNNVSKGQTFIPTASGTLTEIDALVVYGKPPSSEDFPPLQVTVATSLAGIPVTSLATITMPKDRFTYRLTSTEARHTFDFKDFRIRLDAGAQYMVLFETPFGVAGENGVHSAYFAGWPAQRKLGLTASLARDGQNWERFSDGRLPDTRELAIEVKAVPEPATLGLILIAVLLSRCCFRGR
jgi:hypothetical protein